MAYGADKSEWDAFVKLGVSADLLPVVSNPNAVISPSSSLTSLGKTPSRYNKHRQVGGIKDWTSYQASETDITNWSAEPDYGICVQCRHIRAFDVDVADEFLSDEIKSSIKALHPEAVFRTRDNSQKFLFPFFLEGTYTKRDFSTSHGKIEFLAQGQQFIAAGTHPSGSRYLLDIPNIITLTKQEFDNLFSHLLGEYSNNTYTEAHTRKPFSEPLDIDDDVATKLKEKNLVIGTGREGQLHISCPFKDEHTTPNGRADTSYFPAGTRAYYNGHFHCFHSHCQDKTDDDFKLALDLYDDFDTISDDDVAPSVLTPSSCDIIVPDGLIKDTADWITASAFKQQPVLSLLATLTFAGAVFGRRYALDKEDTRTNLYTVGIAGTGEGKDHPRKCIKKLAYSSNLDNFIGADDVKSGQGSRKALMRNPSQIMLLDEFGMLLEGITHKNAPAHYRITAKILTELYSSSSTIYKAGEGASDKDEQIVIVEPNLCIYGTTTMEKYKHCITMEAINSGELNRFIVAATSGVIPDYNETPSERSVPSNISRKWSEFTLAFSETMNADDKILVKLGRDAEMFIKASRKHEVQKQREFSSLNGDGTGPLYGRYTENTIKLAMIYAIADNRTHPIITVQHLEAGESIVKNGILFLQAMIDAGMLKEDSTPQRREFAEDKEKIINVIKQLGGKATRSDLLKKLRYMSSEQLSKVLSTLGASGEITKEEVKTTGRSATYYKMKIVDKF